MSSCSHRMPSPIREFNKSSSTLKFKKYFYERKKERNILSLIHNGRTQTKQNNNNNNNKNNNITTTLAVRPIKQRKLKLS